VAESPLVQSVLGPLTSLSLGVTLPHEHIFSDSSKHAPKRTDDPVFRHYDEPIRLDNQYDIRRDHVNIADQKLTDADDAVAEITLLRETGGETVVELTPPALGRDPLALRDVARQTGVNIIMGCGYYVGSYHPPALAARTEEDIAEELLNELINGVVDGIRPGLIGEIGMSWPPTPAEERVLRASARTQALRSVGLVIHPGRDPQAPVSHIRFAEAAGADVSRCVMSHVDRTLFTMRDLLALARTGCYVEFDLFGIETSHYSLAEIDLPNDATRVNLIAELFAAGHGRQVLVSHDICNKTRLSRYGGEGYGHLLSRVVPVMRRKGFTPDDINLLFVENPSRMLTGSASRNQSAD
jgi:phosphotriesterase-related protein